MTQSIRRFRIPIALLILLAILVGTISNNAPVVVAQAATKVFLPMLSLGMGEVELTLEAFDYKHWESQCPRGSNAPTRKSTFSIRLVERDENSGTFSVQVFNLTSGIGPIRYEGLSPDISHQLRTITCATGDIGIGEVRTVREDGTWKTWFRGYPTAVLSGG